MMIDWSAKKLTFVSILVTLGLAALFWGVYELEEHRKAVRTHVVGEGEDGTFRVEVADQKQFDLIVFCNEEKFQEAFRAFAESRKLEGTYPPLILPGGPLAIAFADQELPEELQAPKRVAIEYLKRHAPRKVILVAHSNCLLYDSIGAWYDAPIDDVRHAQHEHLIRAKHMIQEWLPETEVEIYYADYQDGMMSFYPMADELLAPSLSVDDFELRREPQSNQQPEKEK